MSSVSKRRKEGSRTKIKSMGDHKEFLKRITKTLYYGELPTLPCLSLPVTEISCEVWSAVQRGRSLRRLHADAAAALARRACVSPCALVLAVLYLERLHTCNPHYLAHATPHDLFLVSLMVGNKFLQDDGEDDEVFCSEWAASGGIDLKQLKRLEVEFLNAIDWNVYVSDKSFEAGLSWLEGEVALRQGRLRGFYTYTDLCALRLPPGGAALLAAAAACLALAVAYVAALATLLAAAPLASRALVFVRTASPAGLTPIPDPVTFVNNATVEFAIDALAEEVETAAAERMSRAQCCGRWADAEPKRRRAPVPWWWRWAAMTRWASGGVAVVEPAQRWLERLAEYAGLPREEEEEEEGGGAACPRPLAALLATLSDR